MGNRFKRRAFALALGGAIPALALIAPNAFADENGVSFWAPGVFGSLAAVPNLAPGFCFLTWNYFDSVTSVRTVDLGGGDHVVVNASARADLQYVYPYYAFNVPAGQLSLGVIALVGPNTTSDTLALEGPGGPISTTSRSASLFSYGDLFPFASFKWGQGPNYFMAYATGDVPVGSYEAARLNVFGIGHGAIDAGVGYTYLDYPKNEFSAVFGLTYNFINSTTQYQNGVDAHLDLAALHYLNQGLAVGAAGYVFDQLTGDSGAGAKFGAFESRVFGAGPQVALFFPVGGMLGYLNLRAFGEFDAANRASGYNLRFTFTLSPSAPSPAPSVVAKH